MICHTINPSNKRVCHHNVIIISANSRKITNIRTNDPLKWVVSSRILAYRIIRWVFRQVKVSMLGRAQLFL